MTSDLDTITTHILGVTHYTYMIILFGRVVVGGGGGGGGGERFCSNCNFFDNNVLQVI